jgi:hypothetical protein
MEQCEADVSADIANYGHVTLDDTMRIIKKFGEATDIEMRVCGTCGIRDPDEKYTLSSQPLAELPDNHWSRVPQKAYERLRDKPRFQVYTRKKELIWVDHTYLHNLHVIKNASGVDRAYHVIPEAVLPNGHVFLCKKCCRCWDTPSLDTECALKLKLPAGSHTPT